jgi:phosphate-selective porin
MLLQRQGEQSYYLAPTGDGYYASLGGTQIGKSRGYQTNNGPTCKTGTRGIEGYA